jgi:hypothetical protein
MSPSARCAVAIGTVLLVALPTAVGAQSELQEWLNPTLGESKPRVDYKFTYYPAERVEGQRTDLSVGEQSFSLNVPVFQDARNELSVTGDTSYRDFDVDARFPDSHRRFPTELWAVQLGGSYRHKFDNDWIGAGGVTVESPTDRPFASRHEDVLRVLAMLRIPYGEHGAIIPSLIYASDNEIVGGIPVPGLAYQYVPSDRFNAVVGAPFSSVEYKPLDPLTLEAQYFPLRRLRARATYALFRPLRLFGGFDIDNDRWFLADRVFHKERLFYYEKRATAGVRFDLRHVGFQLRGGYAFDRYYFQGDDYSDRRHDRINVGAGPFAVAGMSIRF